MFLAARSGPSRNIHSPFSNNINFKNKKVVEKSEASRGLKPLPCATCGWRS